MVLSKGIIAFIDEVGYPKEKLPYGWDMNRFEYNATGRDYYREMTEKTNESTDEGIAAKH